MVRLVTRPTPLLVCVVLAFALAGCARGPDAPLVTQAVQQQLDAALGGRVLAVERLKLAGSAPLSGRDGRLVHFNAELKLARDYDFTRWSAHSVASLAALLGAGPKGIVGLKSDGNRAGDALGVYGTAAFVRDGTNWQLVANPLTGEQAAAPVVPAARVAAVQPQPREAPPPTASQQALDRLAALVAQGPPPNMSPALHETILREELENAYAAASQRLARKADLLVVAGGPAGGAYEATVDALRARAKAAKVMLDAIVGEGSVGNIRMLSDRTAQFALVQNDVARNAYLGRGRFAGAPQAELRAVASLFPEPVQLIARADAGIATIADLRGKRVGLGPEGSGSRTNALALLAANGVPVVALGAVNAAPLPEALNALGEGALDAVFATIHAPAREIQRLATNRRLAFVPIGPSKELLDAGLVPITLPARTYPGQDAPLPTVAATALLVTRADVPATQVNAMLELLFARREDRIAAAVAQIAPRTAREGVTIPWQPTADTWLAAHGAPQVAPPPAPEAAPAR